jgi:cation diffusion facilitator CzcD-associated flavoprotein CzcO
MAETRLVDHLIIGSGFAGLCAAIKLQEDGERDFVVIERGHDVGGTWRDNTYPGAACDVPSQLYSFSFALNPEWSSSYSPQPEIQAYLKKVAAESGVLDRFVFDTTVEHAAWDAEQDRWVVETSAGTWAARTVIACAGGLSEPKMPDIDGLGTFQGDLFHSAQWDHDVDLAGKRIAVIGTGASAIQIIPQLQKVAGRVDVYQRTAPWVMPKNVHGYSDRQRLAMRRVPGWQRLIRTAVYLRHEIDGIAFTSFPQLFNKVATGPAIASMKKQVEDPGLREKVTPTFQMGCKRILLSDDYYPALTQDNVEVVTDPIAKLTGTGVVTADGTEREVDVVVVCTGFYTTELPMADHLVGKHGQTLAHQWRDTGMQAYKASTIPNFPNLFFAPGPNAGLGHTSMVLMIEAQVRYAVGAIRVMRERGYTTVEVDQDVHDDYNRDLQRRMQRTVWVRGGCDSWYLDEHGRNTTLWPRSTADFIRRLARFDTDAYTLSTAATKEKVPA